MPSLNPERCWDQSSASFPFHLFFLITIMMVWYILRRFLILMCLRVLCQFTSLFLWGQKIMGGSFHYPCVLPFNITSDSIVLQVAHVLWYKFLILWHWYTRRCSVQSGFNLLLFSERYREVYGCTCMWL